MKKYIKYIVGLLAIVSALILVWSFESQPKIEEVPIVTENSEREVSIDISEEPKNEQVINEERALEYKKEVETIEEASKKLEDNKDAPLAEKNKKTLCSIKIECSDILNNIDLLEEEKRDLISENGIIFASSDVEFTVGESVFDVIKRNLKNAGIPFEFSLTPPYNSAYIEGINNIYEFDCGERSGWKYSVNGKILPISCSDYKIKDGDKITFSYKIKAY